MALQDKIIGLHMMVQAVEAERGSGLDVPVSITERLAVYLDYTQYWIRNDRTWVKISAELKVNPQERAEEGLQRFIARFIFQVALNGQTDDAEVTAFLANPSVVDQHLIPYISAFTARLSQDMFMQPISLVPRPPEPPLSPLQKLALGQWPAIPRGGGT